METLIFEREGAVGWLRLNRPEKLNAMTIGMWDEMRALGEELVEDPDLRALIVSGEGRAFSAGIDTSAFTSGEVLAADEDLESRHEDPTAAAILRTQEAFTWLEDAPYPTIAAVHGYALGAGIQLALACDLRVVARGARLGVFEQRYGIMPDLGGTWSLPRLVGVAKAKELTWTAAELGAEEAHRLGLCERVVADADLEGTVRELAGTLAAQPPLAVRGAKEALDLAGRGSREDVLRLTAERQAVCLGSEDFAEAISALVEQRAPEFRGR